MPTLTLSTFHLRFRSPLHLSKGKEDDYGESEEVLHADTLKSALFVCARRLFGEAVIHSFFERFRVSSAYPFLGGERFFPKPSVRLQGFSAAVEETKQAKKHKKIAYLGQVYFEDLITHRQRTLDPAHLSADGRFISDHPDVQALGAGWHLLRSEVQQRVSIPLDHAEDPTPYYVDRLFFRKGAGLWFAFVPTDPTDAEIGTWVRAALRLLGDEGIGTDRSVGNGQFDFDPATDAGTLTLHTPDQPTHQLLLSLWCPRRAELSEEFLLASSYGLLKRGGYLASPENPAHLTYRKKSVYMFNEGSVFPHGPILSGKIENLKPDAPEVTQPVWRDGLALTIPITQFPDTEP